MTRWLAIFSFALLIMAVGSAPPAEARCGDDCHFLTDDAGERLGATFERENLIAEGEMAIYLPRSVMVLVTCRGQNRFGDTFYMRRRSRNCSGHFAAWPKRLMTAVAVIATVKPVALFGPPSTCGMCMPSPFEDFDLPDGVIVIEPDFMKQMMPDIYDDDRVMRQLRDLNGISPLDTHGRPTQPKIYIPNNPLRTFPRDSLGRDSFGGGNFGDGRF